MTSAAPVPSTSIYWNGRRRFFERLWQASLLAYDKLEGIAWEWQSLDGAMVKAPMALESAERSSADRGKKDSQRSLLVDKSGVRLSIVLSGANIHDVKLLTATLDGIVVAPPSESPPGRTSAWMPVMWAGRPNARMKNEAMSRMSGRAAKRLRKWTRP